MFEVAVAPRWFRVLVLSEAFAVTSPPTPRCLIHGWTPGGHSHNNHGGSGEGGEGRGGCLLLRLPSGRQINEGRRRAADGEDGDKQIPLLSVFFDSGKRRRAGGSPCPPQSQVD